MRKMLGGDRKWNLSLGLLHRQTMDSQRYSEKYLKEDWIHVTKLYGMGKYVVTLYFF